MSNSVSQKVLERVAEEPALPKSLEREIVKLQEELLPGSEQWKRFLEIFLLSFGALSIVAGAIFFFAYNWADLHRLGKIGTAVSLFVIATGIAVFQKPDTIQWKISAMTASLFIGVNLALLGQIYQTGADAWQLFFWWSVLALPFGVVVRFMPLWMFLTIIGQTTLSLLSVQWFGGSMLWFHGLPLTILFIFLSYYQKGELREKYRNYRTTVGAFLTVWYSGIASYTFIFYGRDVIGHWDSEQLGMVWVNPIFSLAFTIWIYHFFLTVRQNRAITALMTAGIGWNLFLFLNHNLFGWEVMYDSLFFFTLIILGACTFAVIKVIKLCDSRWEGDDE